MLPQEKVTLLETLLASAFAGMGGLLAYMMRALNRDEKPVLARIVVEGLSSAFVGLIAMLMCKGFDIDFYWSGVIVGVFGWMGAETSISLIGRVIRVRLGIDTNESNKNS